MDRYAVFGHPIAHSQSPRIHRWFAEQTGQALEYHALLAPLDAFAETVRHFFAEGGAGANVTLPFKQEALDLCQTLTERAQLAGAVNTLARQTDGSLLGDNTDGIGLLRDIQTNLQFDLRDRKVLLLGAGGAARGIIQPLLTAGISRLTLTNRTLGKAETLLQAFRHLQPQTDLQALDWQQLQPKSYDLVINATSASLSQTSLPLPDRLFTPRSLAYDLVYAARPTPFMQWAEAQGASQQADGLGMLIEQAAEAFLLWRGVRPETKPLIDHFYTIA